MLTQEEIDRIIREDLDKGEVSTAFLTDNNISLEAALKNGLLTKKEDGKYSVLDYPSLRKLLLHSRKIKEYRYSFLVSKKCYELRPNDLFSIENYFFRLLKEKMYEEAYEIFLKMVSLGSYNYKTEENLFKLLFSRIIDIPEEDLAYVKLLRCEDYMVPEGDVRFADIFIMNNARRQIYFGNDKVAVRLLMDYAESLAEVPVALNAIVNLANASFHEYVVLQINVKEYIKNEDYEKALAAYQEREKKTPIKVKDNIIMHLLETLIKLKKGEEVFNNDVFFAQDAFSLILNDNFVKARECNNKREDEGKKNELITILLDKVCEALTMPEKANVSMEDIEEALMLDDYRQVFYLVSMYLKKYDRGSLYPYAALVGAYDKLNTTDYMLDFLKDIEKPKFDADAIKSAFDRDFMVRNFANCLLYYYMLLFLWENKIVSNIDIEYYGEKLSHKKQGFYGNEEVTLRNLQSYANVRMCTIPYSVSTTKAIGPKGKYEVLFAKVKNMKTLEIFETEDKAEYSKICYLADQDENIKVSAIKGPNGYIMFVKYVKDKRNDEFVDNNILANEAYINKNYKAALKFYLKAMCYTSNFSIELITKIALCYLELEENQMAAKYLETASILCQIRGLEDDFAEYVSLLQTNAEISPNMYSMVERLEYTVNFDEPYEEIARLIVEDGLSFEEATGKYNLSIETIFELKLYYAEYAYVLGNEKMGGDIINEIVNTAPDYYKRRALDLYNNRDEVHDSLEVTPFVRKYILG